MGVKETILVIFQSRLMTLNNPNIMPNWWTVGQRVRLTHGQANAIWMTCHCAALIHSHVMFLVSKCIMFE